MGGSTRSNLTAVRPVQIETSMSTARNVVPARDKTSIAVLAGVLQFAIFAVLAAAVVIVMLPVLLLMLVIWACLFFLFL